MKTKFIKNTNDFKKKVFKTAVDFKEQTGDKIKPSKWNFFNRKTGVKYRIEIGEDNLPLFYHMETSGIGVVGKSGIETTIVMQDILNQVDNFGFTEFVYDPDNSYSSFYREGQDVLIKPFCSQSAKYNLFDEFVSYENDGKLIDNKKLDLIVEVITNYKKSYCDDNGALAWKKRVERVLKTIFLIVASSKEKPSMKDFFDFVKEFNSISKLREKFVEENKTEFRNPVIDFLEETAAGFNTYAMLDEIFKTTLAEFDFLSGDGKYFSVEGLNDITDKRVILSSESVYSSIILELLAIKTLEANDSIDRRIIFCVENIFSLGLLKTLQVNLPELGRTKGVMCLYSYHSYDKYVNEFRERTISNLSSKIILKIEDGKFHDEIKENVGADIFITEASGFYQTCGYITKTNFTLVSLNRKIENVLNRTSKEENDFENLKENLNSKLFGDVSKARLKSNLDVLSLKFETNVKKIEENLSSFGSKEVVDSLQKENKAIVEKLTEISNKYSVEEEVSIDEVFSNIDKLLAVAASVK